MTRFALIAVLALGCRQVELHHADVTLEIDGESHDYATEHAQWEEEQGRVSVYLVPADVDNADPYVNLRYYSGNPVAHFWLRHGGDDEHKPKWECFVPGVLMDGTETLGWTKPNGEPRERTDTGETDCHVTIARDDAAITLDFDASLLKEHGGKGDGHGGGGGDEAAEGEEHEEHASDEHDEHGGHHEKPMPENPIPNPPPQYEAIDLVDNVVQPDVFWGCTTCRACEEFCPVLISYVDKIVDLRRNQVLVQGEFPPELAKPFEAMETNGNPWNLSRMDRAAWAEGLDVPTMAENPDTEVLYWVGCAASYDDRAKKVARALVRLLKAAGVKFAILGEEESCTGDSARRAGNEFLFAMLAEANVDTAWIRADPHGFAKARWGDSPKQGE